LSLPVLEIRNPKNKGASKAVFLLVDLGEKPFLSLFQLLKDTAFISLWP
jgi:hypothetical protein